MVNYVINLIAGYDFL